MKKINILTTVLLTTLVLGLCMPSVYSLPMVEFAATYEVHTPGGDSIVDSEIWVSIHYSDGSVTHVEVTDTPSGTDDPYIPDVEDPAIAMAPNGNIIVAWEQPTAWVTNATDRIYYAVLGLDGSIIKSPTQLSTDQGNDPCVAVTPNNVVFIVWESEPNGDDVVGYVTMNDRGGNVSPIREITGFDDIDDPTVAASIQNGVDNRVVVAWEDPDEVVVSILDSTGLTLVPKKMLTSGSAQSNSEINAAILPNGDAVLVWERDDGAGSDDLYYTVIDKEGMTVVPVTVINRPNDVSNPAVAVTPGGNIVIVWDEEPAASGNDDVWYLILDRLGNTVKGATRLTTYDGANDDPDVAVDVAGNVVIIYEQPVANPDKIDFGILSSTGQLSGTDELTDGTDDIDLDGDEGRRQVAVRPSQPAPVGGVVSPVNKLELIAPYLALAGLIVAVSTIFVIKKRKD